MCVLDEQHYSSGLGLLTHLSWWVSWDCWFSKGLRWMMPLSPLASHILPAGQHIFIGLSMFQERRYKCKSIAWSLCLGQVCYSCTDTKSSAESVWEGTVQRYRCEKDGVKKWVIHAINLPQLPFSRICSSHLWCEVKDGIWGVGW